MKKVGIVICNYNKADRVLECIQCILESKFQDFDLYVVDNASTDGAPEAIRREYGDQVTLIVNRENLGGSGGFNTGLRAAYEKGYPYLMCVDNDAMLDENAVGELYHFLETHPEAGMAGSKIYHLETPDYIQQFGQKIDFEFFCTEVPHLNWVEDNTMPDWLYVDSVAACSLMVRRSTIDKIGFLPEDHFLYWDDTEWCYKCNRAGMKVASVGTSKALHAMGGKAGGGQYVSFLLRMAELDIFLYQVYPGRGSEKNGGDIFRFHVSDNLCRHSQGRGSSDTDGYAGV